MSLILACATSEGSPPRALDTTIHQCEELRYQCYLGRIGPSARLLPSVENTLGFGLQFRKGALYFVMWSWH